MIRKLGVCLLLVFVMICTVAAEQSLTASKEDVQKEKAVASGKAAEKNLAVSKCSGTTEMAVSEKESKPVTLKEAVVHMPGMTKETIQKTAEVLKEFEGIENMKPDFEAKNLHVIYGGKLDFKAGVMEKLKAVDSEAKLIEIKQAEAAAAGKCGGCPSRSKCAGATKTESKKEAPEEKAGC